MTINPILVTGPIRSGTTWVGRVLEKAPGVALIHEPFNIDHPQGVFAHHWPHQYAFIDDRSEEAAEVERALTDTLSFRYRPMRHLASFEGVRRTAGLARDLPRFWYRRVVSRPRGLMKDPIAVFSAPWLVERFDMDVVITTRHPAAFTWSYLRIGEPNRLGDLLAQPALMEGPLTPLGSEIASAAADDDPVVQAATLWRAVHHVIDHYRATRPDWLLRRHEDLSLNPVGEFSKLFHELDLDFTPMAQGYLERTSNPQNPVEAPPGVLHQLHRDSRQNVSAWRHRLSPEVVNRIRGLTADISDHFYDAASWHY